MNGDDRVVFQLDWQSMVTLFGLAYLAGVIDVGLTMLGKRAKPEQLMELVRTLGPESGAGTPQWNAEMGEMVKATLTGLTAALEKKKKAKAGSDVAAEKGWQA